MGMETLGMALVMAGATMYSSHQQSKASAQVAKQEAAALEEQKKQAASEAERNREQLRASQSKEADVSSILKQNQSDLLSGGNTLLTGAEGVQNSELTLNKKSQLA